MSIFPTGVLLVPWGTYVDVNPMLPTAVRFPFAVTLFRTINLVRWSQLVICPGAQSPVNFWVIEIHRYIDSAVVATLNTTSVPAGVNTLLVSVAFPIQTLSDADHGLYLQCTPNGAPGNLLCIAPALEFTG